MSELNERTAVFTLLGELRADVKHILAGLERSRADMEQMREDFQQDMKDVNDRLAKVERFNARMIAYASVVVPVALILLQWGLPALLTIL